MRRTSPGNGHRTLRSALRIGAICVAVASGLAGCASDRSSIWVTDLPPEPTGTETTLRGRACDLDAAVEYAASQIGMTVASRSEQVSFVEYIFVLKGLDDSEGLLTVWYGRKRKLREGSTILIKPASDWSTTSMALAIHLRIGPDGDAAREAVLISALDRELTELGKSPPQPSHSGVLAPRAGS